MKSDSLKRRAYRFRKINVIHRIFALMLAISVVWQGQLAYAQSGFEEIQDGDIWRQCEGYYTKIDSLQKDERHYLIRDASSDFINTYQSLKPRTKQEALLFIECINLANGNAVYAFEQLKRQEAKDDEFLDLARVDATNNSNASQFEYMSEIDGKYDMKTDLELAQATYDDMIRQARAKAMERVMLILGTVAAVGIGIAGSYESSNLSSSSSGYNGGSGGSSNFMQMTQMVTKLMQQHTTVGGSGGTGATIQPASPSSVTLAGSGSTSSGTNAGSSWTAPPLPQPASPSGSNSSVQNVNAPATAGEDSVILADPTQSIGTSVTALPTAPKIDASCAKIQITRVDVGFADVTNTCDKPISFFWCWVSDGSKSCMPALMSNIITPGETTEITGPAKGQAQVANVIVCDMSNPDAICGN